MKKRSWSEQQLRKAAKTSTSIRQILGKLGLRQAGGNYSQAAKYLKEYAIPIEHLKGAGWSKGLKIVRSPNIPLEKILVPGSTYQSFKLKRRLFGVGLKKARCEECGWDRISPDGRLPLELDHINGDSKDNRLENLRVLCPNCHSLKPTHRGMNKRKKKIYPPG